MTILQTFIRMLFFFFQAEDGIRDVAVTGVQTCALPISFRASVTLGPTDPNATLTPPPRTPAIITFEMACARRVPTLRHHWRSEERRVGKECRFRWAPCCYNDV